MRIYIYIYIYIEHNRQQTYIKLFYSNQMRYNYKSDEKILKTLIHRNIRLTDPNKVNK